MPKSRATLVSDLLTKFPSLGNKAITAAVLRGFLQDLIDTDIPDNYYFKIDPADGKLTIRGLVNSVDSQVFKFGSGEADVFKSNKIMGGFRQIKPSGEELFLIRQSTAGDRRAVSVGNMDTNTPNSLVCGSAGWRISRMLNTDVLESMYIGTVTTNALGGTRMIINHNADNDASYRKITVMFDQNIGQVKFNTRILARSDLELLSEHQPEDEFMAGGGLDKFKVNITNGLVDLPLSQPFPVPVGTQFRIIYDFDKPVGTFALGGTIMGKRLELGKLHSVVEMTKAKRLALTGDELFDGLQVLQSNSLLGVWTYSRSSGWYMADVKNLTRAQRVAVQADELHEGLKVFQTDSFTGLYEYRGGAWHSISTKFGDKTLRLSYLATELLDGTVFYQTEGARGFYIFEDGGWTRLRGDVMTKAERDGLSGSQALWNGREIYQTDGQSGKYIRMGDRWQYMQAFESRKIDVVKEINIMECAQGAWMNKSMVLGGMEFRWSTNTTGSGNLTMVRANGITRASTGATQILMKNGSNVNSDNQNVWSNSLVQLHSSIPMLTPYWLFEYHICTRNNEDIPCNWKITVMYTGSSSLVISGEYTGQRIVS
jgi:hypothetical protein